MCEIALFENLVNLEKLNIFQYLGQFSLAQKNIY
jgi:hypothetical protein